MEYTPLTERVRANPRPAVVWLVGVGLLVAVELGRIASGVLNIGDAIVTAVGAGYGGLADGLTTGGTTALITAVGLLVGLWLVGQQSRPRPVPRSSCVSATAFRYAPRSCSTASSSGSVSVPSAGSWS
ncbi:hypothetical protein [Halovenus salina]|uniref:Uncharacterized protein n=1 Tax=Halovenus salina TaxID=1510225 RepID=A0ABD5VZ77_9EURY